MMTPPPTAQDVESKPERLLSASSQDKLLWTRMHLLAPKPARKQAPMLVMANRRRMQVDQIAVDASRDGGQGSRQQLVGQHERQRIGRQIDERVPARTARRNECAPSLHAADQALPLKNCVGLGDAPRPDA